MSLIISCDATFKLPQTAKVSKFYKQNVFKFMFYSSHHTLKALFPSNSNLYVEKNPYHFFSHLKSCSACMISPSYFTCIKYLYICTPSQNVLSCFITETHFEILTSG